MDLGMRDRQQSKRAVHASQDGLVQNVKIHQGGMTVVGYCIIVRGTHHTKVSVQVTGICLLVRDRQQRKRAVHVLLRETCLLASLDS